MKAKKILLILKTVLLFLIINSSLSLAINGDKELLRIVALANKANYESIMTWKADVFEEGRHTRGDYYDYLIKNDCVMVYDQLQQAVRWNKVPVENIWTDHGKIITDDIGSISNSTMFKGGTNYVYSGWLQPEDKDVITHAMVIREIIRDSRNNSNNIDPRYLLRDAVGNSIYDRLMYFYERAEDFNSFYIKREGDLVILEMSPGEIPATKYIYDLSAGGTISEHYNKTQSGEITHKYTYEEKAGVWIIKSYKRTIDNKLENGDTDKSYRILQFNNSVVNVPFDEDEFTIEKMGIKLGDKIHDWRLEKVYTYDGILREPQPSPKTLVGNSLPQSTNLGIKLSSTDKNDCKIIVCFFDYQQRPSRNAILQLSTRAEELKAQGVEIIAIQASTIEQATLDNWLKENNISFLVGMIKDDVDLEQAKYTWGIQSLPWLILTDDKHIVTAEGFAMSELDRKISIQTK